MSASATSKASAPASPDATRSRDTGGFYLQSRTKVAILATCMVLMLGGSIYAVLQPLNAEPTRFTPSTRFWYPRETNPYARLPYVDCPNDKADDYACRLNSIAVSIPDAANAADDSQVTRPEVWAVGNFGLVLHRAAGQYNWEQLKIAARAEASPPPSPAQSTTPTPPRPFAANPRVTTPAATPAVRVPALVGLGLDAARTTALRVGLQLAVEYEPGAAPNAPPQKQQQQQQQPGPSRTLVVVSQSPSAGTVVPPKTTVMVRLGSPPKAAASLLIQRLVPVVYAAEKAKVPAQAGVATNTPSAEVSSRANSNVGVNAVPPSTPFLLDDDLIYVSCSNQTCHALGRSGRIYNVAGKEWAFKQARFNLPAGAQGDLSLISAMNGGRVIAKVGDSPYLCSTSSLPEARDKSLPFTCAPWSDGSVFKGNQPIDKASQLANGPVIFLADTFTSSNNSLQRLLLGENGFIGKSSSAQGSAAPVTVVPTRTTAALRAFAFGKGARGYIAGDHGLVLTTSDDGATWFHETRGPEAALPNHRLPAPWYWLLAFLLIVTCSAVVATPPPPPPTEFSVADWTVTDAPLKPGDVDSLDFTPMALGLSRFIRNPKTQPPVTIAIEGEWGEGKSSVMSLLRGDLEKSRYRPVWFNAWHHQSEEQLLAALLQHIKDQAVPPWWHIDNWIFRARLLHFRLRDKWPLMILLLLALCGSLSYELSRHGVSLPDIRAFASEMSALIKYFLPWSRQDRLPADIGHYSVVATVLAVLAAIFQKARAFGINPSKLTDNLRDAATIKDVKPDPGVRPRFAREFGDFCNAWSWGGRRVIIFIDDLDRCRPESVVTVLESINFLTTAGDCIIVLGMARNQVTHCVGLGFKEIALAEAAYEGGGNTEQEKAVARFKYGTFYIKKLVNIVAPLPKTTSDQRRRVLELKAAEILRKEDEEQAVERLWRVRLWESLAQTGRMTAKIAPVLLLLAAFVSSVVVGYQKGVIQPLASLQKSSNAEVNSNPSSQQPVVSQNDFGKPLPFQRPDTKPGDLKLDVAEVEGSAWSYGVDAIFLLALFGILAYQLSARTNLDAQNSPEFEDSLKLWGHYIVMVCDTPREIKRALNDLRYQAMTRRVNGPSTTRAERLLRTLRQRVTGFYQPAAVEKRVDEAALPPHKAAELANLTGHDLQLFLDPDYKEVGGSQNLKLLMEIKLKHINQFHRWIPQAAPESQTIYEDAAENYRNPPQTA